MVVLLHFLVAHFRLMTRQGMLDLFASSLDIKSKKKYTLYAQKVVYLWLQIHHKGLLP